MKKTKTTLLFLRRNDEILLAMKKRGHGDGKWNGAGGKIEPGETIERAMIRETKEEIGVTPIDYNQVAEISFVQYDKEELEAVRMSVFIATKWTGEPTESEEMAPKWFKIDEIPYDHMFADDKYWLPRVLDGQTLKARFKFDKNWTMEDYEIKEVDSF